MAAIDVGTDEVVVHLSALEKVGGLSRDLRIPRASIRSAAYSADLFAEKRGLRVAGTAWPRRIYLGHFVRRGTQDFLAVHGTPTGVLLELSGSRYGRVLVSLPEDEAKRVVDQL
jgi:hypothetical protein